MVIKVFALDHEIVPGLEVREILPQGTTYEEAKAKARVIGENKVNILVGLKDKDNIFHSDGILVKRGVVL